MKRLIQFLCCSMLLCVVNAGCGQRHINDLTKKVWYPEKVTFPELEHVWSYQEPGQPIGISHTQFLRTFSDMELETKQTGTSAFDAKQLAKFIKDPGFQSRLKALEDATIPANHASPKRDESRRKYVQEWRDLEKKLSASGAKSDDVRKSLDSLYVYYQQIQYIEGQSPPTGAAAEKYSAVQPYDDPPGTSS